MKLDSKWQESILETSDIFAALIIGTVFEKAIESVVLLVFGIEFIVAVVVIGIAVLLKKFRVNAYKSYRKLVLKGARWIVGIWAGLLFAIGYSLFLLLWPVGVILLVVGFGFVTSIIYYSKIVEVKPQPEITKAGVRDPIFDTPKRVELAEIRGIGIGVALVIMFFGAYTWGVNTYIKGLSVEQVNLSSTLIVQMDSFLTAGWIFGFFYYWGEWEKALRASKRAQAGLRGLPKDAIQFKTTENVISYYRMESNLAPTSKLFVELVLGVVMFILSAIAAVYAVLTYTILAVQLELEFLVGGVLVMIMSWIILRPVTYQLRAQTDTVLGFGG